MKPPRSGVSQTMLRPLAALYGGLVHLRNRYYDDPRHQRRVSVPVISVGNLTAGGTGKTPVVSWLARRLSALGRRPAVVSRGYGGRAGRGPLVVSRGEGPLCAAETCGDEPYLLSRLLPGIPILVGADRHRTASSAAEEGADVVLLDDGFQHRRLHRDLDIVLIDGDSPFGNGRLIPAGPLREPPGQLARAGLVLITRVGPGESRPELQRRIRAHHPSVRILLAGHRPVGWIDASGRRVPAPERALAFCGVGSPEVFRRDLMDQGLDLVAFHAFGDHHRYRDEEWRRLREAARRSGASLVTTEKDIVRLGPQAAAAEDVPLVALRIEAQPFAPDALLEAVAEKLP